MKVVSYYWVVFMTPSGENGFVFSGTFNQVLQKARKFAQLSLKVDGEKMSIIEIKRV